jgi:hypothetical protein
MKLRRSGADSCWHAIPVAIKTSEPNWEGKLFWVAAARRSCSSFLLAQTPLEARRQNASDRLANVLNSLLESVSLAHAAREV